MGISKPSFTPLTPEDAAAIDRNARRILREIGISIDRRHFLEQLAETGAEADYEKLLLRPGDAWLDDMIARAPSSFVLHSRDGTNDVELGSGRVHFANGGRVFRILNMLKGKYRRTKLKDIANTALLVDHLDNINVYIIACQAHDLPADNYHFNDFFCAFDNTTKHVMGGCDDLAGAEQMWRLASMIAGGEDQLRERPFVSVITNMISPLTIDSNTLHILSYCSARGIPVTCATAPIAGATAPMTLAGTLSQMHAEALAGVAITQAITPGAKVLYGTFPTVMDMKTMEVSMGSVEMGMMNAAAVQLAKLYNLPIYASGGVTEAKRPDIQAGFEKNFSNLTVAMMGADFIHLTAGLMDSAKSISYEQFVIDDENIAMIHKILNGIAVDDDSLGFDVIRNVGPRGNYLMEEHTVQHLGSVFYPRLAERCSFDVWEQNGKPNMLKRAKTLVTEILGQERTGCVNEVVRARVAKAFPGLKQPRRRSKKQAGDK